MSRTYRKQIVEWSSPRFMQQKRPKQTLEKEILESLREIQSPFYQWHKQRMVKRED